MIASLQLPCTPIGTALRKLFEELARRIQPQSPLRIILAGGMAAHLYEGKDRICGRAGRSG